MEEIVFPVEMLVEDVMIVQTQLHAMLVTVAILVLQTDV
jgi:hypothetical protein